MKTPTVLALMIMQIGLVQAQDETQSNDDDQIVITATRKDKKKLDVPETVDVVTRRQMDSQNITNTQDLVRHLPGVNIGRQTSGTDPFGNLGGFTIRGASSNRIQMQVDGARMIEGITDGNRNFIDLTNLKSVEIVRGPGSVLWGADALGGIVAFRTLDPDDLLKGRSFGGKASMGFNSFNKEYSQSGSLAAQFTETTQGLLSVTHRKYNEGKLKKARADGGIWGCARGEDAIRCNQLNPLDADVFSVLSKFVWTPNENHEVKLTGEYFSSDSDVRQLYDFGRQPNGSFNGDYLRNQRQTRTRIALEDIWRPETPYFDQIKWQISYSPQKRNVTGNRKQINTIGLPVETYSHTHYKETFLQADVQLSSSFYTGPVQHQLTYGFQGDQTKTDYDNLNITNTAGTVVVRPAGGFNFANAKTYRADVYLQDEIKFFEDKLTITPGVRWATYKIKPETDKDYNIIPDKEPRDIDSERLIPQISFLAKVTDNYSLYGRYAEGFKMPTAQQLFTSLSFGTSNMIPNPDLKAEKVKSYEAGVRGEFENVRFSFGGFTADYSDFIQSFVQIGPNEYSYDNISKVNIWGIETSAEWQFLPSWALNASASYQYGKQKASPTSDKTYFNGVSPLNGSLGLKWTKPEWRLESEFIGNFSKGVTRTASENNFKPAGYGVYDTYLNWKLSKNVTVSASIQNIFNKRYFDTPLNGTYQRTATAATQITNPLELQVAPGRTYGLNLSTSF